MLEDPGTDTPVISLTGGTLRRGGGLTVRREPSSGLTVCGHCYTGSGILDVTGRGSVMVGVPEPE